MARLTLQTGETLDDIAEALDMESTEGPLLDDARAVHDELDETRQQIMAIQTRLRRLPAFKMVTHG